MTIEQDYIDLFTHKRKGHMAKYVHMYRPDIYEAIIKQDTYYPFWMESKLLKEMSNIICKDFNDIRYVLELGPGSQTPILSKTIPFLKTLKSKLGLFTYTAVDSTREYAEKACALVAQHLNDIKTQPLEIDFLSQKAFHKIEKIVPPNYRKLIIGFGQPIFANNNNDDIAVLIKNIGSILDEEDFFVFGIDTNNETEIIEAAYNTKLTRELLLNVMHHLKVSLNLEGFNPEAFDLIYKWSNTRRSVILSLRSQIKQTFKISGKELVINAKQVFNILKSKKPTVDVIKNFLKKENIIIKEIISIDNNKHNKFSIVIAKKNISIDSS